MSSTSNGDNKTRRPSADHRLAQDVVVGEVILETREAAGGVERRAFQRQAGAESAAARTERLAHGRHRQKAVIDVHRRQIGPKPAGRNSAIETGDQTDARIGQGRGHRGDIVGRHAHVAVGDRQHIVARQGQHGYQIGDLEIARVGGSARREFHVDLRELGHQPANHRNRGIGGIGDSEYELKTGIILETEGA